MQCSKYPVGLGGLRPAFDCACERPNGFVGDENRIPEPLDLAIEFVYFDFIKPFTVQQPPASLDQALRAPDNIKSTSYDDVEHAVAPAWIIKCRA